jgi:hypothetical protein
MDRADVERFGGRRVRLTRDDGKVYAGMLKAVSPRSGSVALFGVLVGHEGLGQKLHRFPLERVADVKLSGGAPVVAAPPAGGVNGLIPQSGAPFEAGRQARTGGGSGVGAAPVRHEPTGSGETANAGGKAAPPFSDPAESRRLLLEELAEVVRRHVSYDGEIRDFKMHCDYPYLPAVGAVVLKLRDLEDVLEEMERANGGPLPVGGVGDE